MRTVLYSVAVLCATVLAMDEVAAPATCTTTADCPALVCRTATACKSGRCEYTQVAAKTLCPGKGCSNGGGCDDDPNDYCNDQGVCTDAFKSSTTTCRAGSDCYDDAKCDGKSGTCPTNPPSATTKVCTGKSNYGPCDATTDYCDGKGSCKENYLPNTKVCQAGGACTEDAKCTGTSSTCPANAPSPTTKACTGKNNGGPCDAPTDYCDGAGNCKDNYLPSTKVCQAGGACTEDAKCTGTSSTCPANAPSPTTKACTGKNNSGPCDAATDYCDGAGNCKDNYLPSTKVCQAGGACTEDAKCTGTSSICPANAPSPATKTCTGEKNGGLCDGQDLCDGAGKCKDVFFGSKVLCATGATLCDANTFCDGACSTCPVRPKTLVYLDGNDVTMTTYLSDTVTQCSAKAVAVGSNQLMAMYTTTTDHVVLIVACVAAVVVVAAVTAKKVDRFVSVEDGYSPLTGDTY
ncbi:hypothetical protein ACHHYP_03797 [Achlya hypogyna]|uniref:Disintegrin domain-containing protein n=1 Tax=Achlya hypogyna TaxID=1202772 RepID=A0A1V9Z3E6_ACHHY|nr:hypothetical protein ACHHYP_03797 [Achlya hypogyna]